MFVYKLYFERTFIKNFFGLIREIGMGKGWKLIFLFKETEK